MSEGAGIPSSMPNNQCVNAARAAFKSSQRVSRQFASMKAEITRMRQEVTELESERV